MIRTGSAIFFESPADFTSNCYRDPYGRGYSIKPGSGASYPIEYPSAFPAAFKYESDWDPHFVGSYVEVDFDKAHFAAVRGLESEIENAEQKLNRLNILKNTK